MGITLSHLESLQQKGLLPPGARVLDIGSSNLYSADEAGLKKFLAYYGKTAPSDLVQRLAAGSAYGHGGVANESFVGELLEAAGITYLAFDIADGYRTQIFDLNSQALQKSLAKSFDIVLNFGTTEHVMNQLNAMRVIHDATKVGGHIVHSVPSLGYIDHGYVAYTPRFFFDLAGHNQYEIIEFRYEGPSEGKQIMGIVRDYQTYFPALTPYIENDPTSFQATDFAIYLIQRRSNAGAFKVPMERSTSVIAGRAAVAHGIDKLSRILGRFR